MVLVDEMNRLGIETIMGMGIFCVDFAAYFPYTNQEILDLDFSLSTEKKESGEIINLRDMSVLNHRYPNTGWVTMSQKFGRKKCRLGCLIQKPHEELAKFKWLNIAYGFKTGVVHISIPMDLHTSDEASCVAAEIRCDLKEPNEPKLSIKVHGKCSDTEPFVYVMANDENAIQKNTAMYGHDRVISLTPANDKDDVIQSGYVVYQETVRLIAQRLKDVWI